MAMNHIQDITGEKKSARDTQAAKQRSVFRHVLDNSPPGPETEPNRLSAEAKALIGAATHGPGKVICVVVYYILSNPAMETRLRSELQLVMENYPSEMPRWTDLKKLTFLQVCIKEGLR